MKKEIRACDICDKQIGDTYKFSKIKRWKTSVELDICVLCTPIVNRVLNKLQINYDDIETDIKRIVNNIVIGD